MVEKIPEVELKCHFTVVCCFTARAHAAGCLKLNAIFISKRVNCSVAVYLLFLSQSVGGEI